MSVSYKPKGRFRNKGKETAAIFSVMILSCLTTCTPSLITPASTGADYSLSTPATSSPARMNTQTPTASPAKPVFITVDQEVDLTSHISLGPDASSFLDLDTMEEGYTSQSDLDFTIYRGSQISLSFGAINGADMKVRGHKRITLEDCILFPEKGDDSGDVLAGDYYCVRSNQNKWFLVYLERINLDSNKYTLHLRITTFGSEIITPTVTPTPNATKTAGYFEANVWTTYGPYADNNIMINELDIDPLFPATIYAAPGKTNGLYKSLNGGVTWDLINKEFSFWSTNTLLIDPQNTSTLYVSASGDFYNSKDGGATWKVIHNSFQPYCLAIDPNAPNILYAADYRLYKSIDSGYTWSQSPIDEPVIKLINSIVMDPTNSNIVYVGATKGGGTNTMGEILKSENGGDSWKVIMPKIQFDVTIQMAIDPGNPLTVYAATRVGIYKTIDGGNNWNLIDKGLKNIQINDLAIDPSNSAIVYAATQGDGVYKTIDGGGNWFALNNGLPNYERVYSLAIDPQTPTIIYAGTDDGVYSMHQSTN
jgi:photosystem II stability/assembly factor-like uncharacterized protein